MSESLNKVSRFKGDKVVMLLTIFLSMISLYAVASSSDHIVLQLIHLGLCFGALFVFYKIDYRSLSRFSLFFLIIAFVLLVFTLIYDKDKHRSITVFGTNIQTLYLIGFLVVFYISKFIAVRMNRAEELTLKELIAIYGIIVVFCGGMAYANLSTAILLFLTCMVILFVANVKFKYILPVILVAMLAGVIYLSVDVGRGDTGRNRISHFVKTVKGDKTKTISSEQAEYGRQMTLAKAAIARSAWMPTGPGNGVIKKSLPQKDTDFVYATVVEEIGLVGGIAILLFYLILFFRTMQVARKSDGYFGRLLAVGIGFWFTCQALVHIGVNCELLPSTGQTLPFISRGGASLLFSGMMIGVLLNISKNNPESSRK